MEEAAGSIPASITNNALVVQLVETLVLEARCWRFESVQAHQLLADVAQSVDAAASNPACCGFESHLPHQQEVDDE